MGAGFALGQQKPDMLKDALNRVLESRLFRVAPRQSQFLRYVFAMTMTGFAPKETLIGVEVYGRPADYDPKADSIVRVEANRLRTRLREYYNGPGSQDPIRIQLTKGAYACTFEVDVPAVAAA